MWTATRRSSPPSSLPPMNTTGSMASRRTSPPPASTTAASSTSATASPAASSPTSHIVGLTPSPSSSRLATWHMQHPLRPTTTTGFSATICRIPPPSLPQEDEDEEEEEEEEEDGVGDADEPFLAGGGRSATTARTPLLAGGRNHGRADPYGIASCILRLLFPSQKSRERERERERERTPSEKRGAGSLYSRRGEGAGDVRGGVVSRQRRSQPAVSVVLWLLSSICVVTTRTYPSNRG
ncbi:hypothetical protein BHM03_00011632 [Ensete ventricosum]|uniref:Uncharacterized protein n=1 Tax=Ensete ventricosum TaxID=4639 RepID=A0A445MDE1_ENSVE|nr:hypothetical protein BHM03_00011632 [Ensete ventricosum]